MPVAISCKLEPPPPLLPGPPRWSPPSGEMIARTEVIEASSRLSLAANSGAVIFAPSARMPLPLPELNELPPNRGIEKMKRSSVPSFT